MNLIREIRWPIRSRDGGDRYVTRTVGWREEAVSDHECNNCWGTGRQLLGSRSMNCERGIHDTCIGNDQPEQCLCFCHQEVADRRRERIGTARRKRKELTP